MVTPTNVSMHPNSQRAQLLRAYVSVSFAVSQMDQGLTDEEAAQRAGVNMQSCWWKRCSELRERALIEWYQFDYGNGHGACASRVSLAGGRRRLSRITPAGLSWCVEHPADTEARSSHPSDRTPSEWLNYYQRDNHRLRKVLFDILYMAENNPNNRLASDILALYEKTLHDD